MCKKRVPDTKIIMWQLVHIKVSWIEGNEDAECIKRSGSAGKRPAFPHPRFSLLFMKWSTGGMLRSFF